MQRERGSKEGCRIHEPFSPAKVQQDKPGEGKQGRVRSEEGACGKEHWRLSFRLPVWVAVWGAGVRLCMFVPLAGTGVGKHKCDKEPAPARAAVQHADGEQSGLSTAPLIPCLPNLSLLHPLFCAKSQPGARTAALSLQSTLLISVPGDLFSPQLHPSARKCEPSTKQVMQKPPSSTVSLAFHLTAHRGLLQGSKGRVRDLGFV